MKEKNINPKTIVIAGISAFIILVIVITIIGMLGIFSKNPNGVETKIDNFNRYLGSVQKDTKYNTFTALYNIIKTNLQDGTTPPKAGAIIRDGTFNNISNTDNDDNIINYSTFIVDIESVQQSYSAQISWSTTPEADVGSYSIIFTCPKESQLIYPDFKCNDLFTENTAAEEYDIFPIINYLPIDEASYSNNFSIYTQYSIRYRVSEDKKTLTLIITDDTGNSKEDALQKIRDLGYDPSNFIIEYIDNSNSTTPPPRAE